MKSEIQKLLKWRKGVTEEEPLKDYWLTLTDLMTRDEELAYEILNESNEQEVRYFSEVFEDISKRLKSEKFITVIRNLKEKYPNAIRNEDIELAAAAMKKKT